MKVKELIERLQGFDPELEVRINNPEYGYQSKRILLGVRIDGVDDETWRDIENPYVQISEE